MGNRQGEIKMALTIPKTIIIWLAMFNLILIAILISRGKKNVALALTILEVIIIAISSYVE